MFLLLPAGEAFAQASLSEKNIFLDEVQVKPRDPKVWVQKGRTNLFPFLGGHHILRVVDSAGKQSPPIATLNKVAPLSKSTIQLLSVETELEPFDNDSFDVFFFAMQIADRDTLIQRKLVIGKEIKKQRCIMLFAPGELLLLSQTAYLGFEFVPKKINTFLDYKLCTSYAPRTPDFFYHYLPLSSQLYNVPDCGSTFNFKVKYYEQ